MSKAVMTILQSIAKTAFEAQESYTNGNLDEVYQLISDISEDLVKLEYELEGEE